MKPDFEAIAQGETPTGAKVIQFFMGRDNRPTFGMIHLAGDKVLGETITRLVEAGVLEYYPEPGRAIVLVRLKE